jgi:lipopolysaccharide export system protein LptA
MKISNFNRSPHGHLTIFAFCVFLLILLVPSAALPENEAPGTESLVPDGGPIQITADKLISNTNDSNAEFIGNVRVIQGETQIDADRLQIFFSDAPNADGTKTEQSLEKLVASGHVKIKVDNKLAVANKAVYITKNGCSP